MQPRATGCEYYFEKGIHKFIFLKAWPATMDEFLCRLQIICAETLPQDQIRLLTDIRPEGMPPILHVLSARKEFFAQQSQPRRFKSAFLYRHGTLVHMFPTLFDMTHQHIYRRFFLDSEDAEAEAIRWLLSEE